MEIGDLRPDELLVRIQATGVCHTDVVVRDQWYPVPLPAVFGHEGGGLVERVGSAVAGFAPGDRVSLSFNSCSDCRYCLAGRPPYCADFFGRNVGSSRPDGSSPISRNGDPIHGNYFGQSSFATSAVANVRSAVKLTEDIPFEVVAPFGCGIQTGAGSVLNSLRPPAGSSIAVVRGLVEGDSIPQLFIPRLVGLWRQGKFPVDRVVSTYDFDAIDQAVHDAETGSVIKPVLLMS